MSMQLQPHSIMPQHMTLEVLLPTQVQSGKCCLVFL